MIQVFLTFYATSFTPDGSNRLEMLSKSLNILQIDSTCSDST